MQYSSLVYFYSTAGESPTTQVVNADVFLTEIISKNHEKKLVRRFSRSKLTNDNDDGRHLFSKCLTKIDYFEEGMLAREGIAKLSPSSDIG